MGWIFYLVGILLLFADAGGLGIVCIILGMLCHWRFWGVMVVGFLLVRD